MKGENTTTTQMYGGGHKQAVRDPSCIQPQVTTATPSTSVHGGGHRTQSDVLLYLVVHGFLLADQLRAQDQHLLLAHVQLLAGGVELLQEHLVRRRARRRRAGGAVAQQALPHLGQVVLQLLVLRFQLLALQEVAGGEVKGPS